MQILRLLMALTFVLSFSAQASDIQIHNGYIRAIPPTAPVTAAFMEIHNEGDQVRALVSASSSAAETVELHTHTNVDGVMQMRQVKKIDLPADSITLLQPGGLHIMLIGLKKPLKMGDKVLVSLKLDDGSILEMDLPVRKVTGKMNNHNHQHDHKHGHQH